MIVSFDDFLPEVLPDVIGCPDAQAVIAIRNAAIDFCKRGNFWKEALDPLTTAANVSTYDLDSPVNGARVVQIMTLFLDGKMIHPRTEEWLDAHEEEWRTYANVPKWFFQPTPDLLTLARVPDGVYTLTGTVSLAPTRRSTGVEQFVFENYLETIASGAKARLCAIPKKPWSDAGLATYHAGRFDSGIASASVESAKGFTRAPIRTTPYNR